MNVKFSIRFHTYHWNVTADSTLANGLLMKYSRESGPVKKQFTVDHPIDLLVNQNLNSIAHKDLATYSKDHGA